MQSAHFDNSKTKFKQLVLELDENDNILECIKQAMFENKVPKGEIVSFDGYIKDMNVSYVQSGSLKVTTIKGPVKIDTAVGEFKYEEKADHFFGRARVMFKDNGKNFTGVLTKGLAGEKLIITLKYITFS